MSVIMFSLLFSFFFFNDTATTEIYTLSLHDALPIAHLPVRAGGPRRPGAADPGRHRRQGGEDGAGGRGRGAGRGARRAGPGGRGAWGEAMTAGLGKDLIGLERLSPDQIRLILDTAEPFKEVSERP